MHHHRICNTGSLQGCEELPPTAHILACAGFLVLHTSYTAMNKLDGCGTVALCMQAMAAHQFTDCLSR